MADQSKKGMVIGPYHLSVDAVKIRELVDAIGDDNPIYRDPEAALSAGYPGIPCPPTYFTLAFQEFTGAYLEALKTLGVPLYSVLHGEEEYEYLAGIHAGDRLTCYMKIESIEVKQTRSGSMELITLVSRFTNQDALEVARTRSLIIERKKQV